MKPRILVVEDEISLSKQVRELLHSEGFEPTVAENLAEAQKAIQSSYDLILLDWMLPDGQGIEWLKTLRTKGTLTPVLMLTARTDVIDRVLGLELGASDYITKPFEPRELIARIRVRLRERVGATESTSEKQDVLDHSGISLNTSARICKWKSREIDLTKTEFTLLQFFLSNPNRVFSRNELLESVWGYEKYPTTRTVDTHVLQLRGKFDAELFETVHGVGYRFKSSKK